MNIDIRLSQKYMERKLEFPFNSYHTTPIFFLNQEACSFAENEKDCEWELGRLEHHWKRSK